MRLLSTRRETLEGFFERPGPSYAILSHRWTNDECSLQDFTERRKMDSTGYRKIQGFRTFARAQRPSYKWVWVDTCCIDKQSSAETTEAINSMYEWYREARVCVVYLKDLPSEREMDENGRRLAFSKSDWFRRGWTLQELLAPTTVIFCDREWNIYGSRNELAARISAITGIEKAFLSGQHSPQEASVAMRMSWASGRITTKPEDIAYCLLGIFDVNMSPLYGEKMKAFMRLQHEIIKSSDDESIFAWESNVSTGGMLATSPEAFKKSKKTVAVRLTPEERLPYFITNKGLHIRSASDTMARDDVDRSTAEPMGYKDHVLQLGCFTGSTSILTADHPDAEDMWEEAALTIKLKRYGPTWRRVNCKRLGRASNISRHRRRNGSYVGRGVQRLYIVEQ